MIAYSGFASLASNLASFLSCLLPRSSYVYPVFPCSSDKLHHSCWVGVVFQLEMELLPPPPTFTFCFDPSFLLEIWIVL